MIRKLDQNRIYQGLLKEMIVTRKREVLNR